jgi:hypothetical protein
MARQKQRDGLGQAQTAEEDLKEKIFDLDFSVHKSRRYHEKLCAFYGAWRDRMRIVTAIAASGAFFIVVVDYKFTAELITAFVGLWTILDIIVMPDKKHDKHNELCKRFTALAAKIQRMQQTEGAYQELVAERLLLEENEPPCKRLIDLESRNDECRARGYPPDEMVPLTGKQRFLGYYFTYGLGALEEWRAKRDALKAVSPLP